MPPFPSFHDAPGYYSTLAMRLLTGRAPHALAATSAAVWSEGYAMEEFVAELGAAFLCAALASPMCRGRTTPPTSQLDHVLRRDKRAIFAAASQAQKAIDWMGRTGADQSRVA